MDDVMSDLIASAAEASERFGDDELEIFAAAQESRKRQYYAAYLLLQEMLGVLDSGVICRIEPTSMFADKIRKAIRGD